MSTASARALPMFDPALLKPALGESVKRLSPRAQWRNPVMFVVWVGSVLTTLLGIAAFHNHALPSPAFTLAVAVWLWMTVWFANLAEALAEGRGKAQAAALRSAKKRVYAKLLQEPHYGAAWVPMPSDELTSDRVV